MLGSAIDNGLLTCLLVRMFGFSSLQFVPNDDCAIVPMIIEQFVPLSEGCLSMQHDTPLCNNQLKKMFHPVVLIKVVVTKEGGAPCLSKLMQDRSETTNQLNS